MTKKHLPPDPDGMNSNRAEWAASCIRHFQCQTGTDWDDAVSDLLCDLMHFCDREGFAFAEELGRAERHYNAETEAPGLLAAAQAALDYLTDHAIDLNGEPEEMLAGIRIDLADAIAKARGGAS